MIDFLFKVVVAAALVAALAQGYAKPQLPGEPNWITPDDARQPVPQNELQPPSTWLWPGHTG